MTYVMIGFFLGKIGTNEMFIWCEFDRDENREKSQTFFYLPFLYLYSFSVSPSSPVLFLY